MDADKLIDGLSGPLTTILAASTVFLADISVLDVMAGIVLAIQGTRYTMEIIKDMRSPKNNQQTPKPE